MVWSVVPPAWRHPEIYRGATSAAIRAAGRKGRGRIQRALLGLTSAVLAFVVGGCAILEKEATNRGGYLDSIVDEHWLKADSKRMRALRAFAIQVSLARIASVSAKNDSDRQLLAIRIGALTKRYAPIHACAFNLNPLNVAGAEKDPCFYFDSAMVDYSTGLFDLAMIALPVDDARKLVNTVTGSFVNPVNVVDLLDTLLTIGKEALKYGRVVGALYRDTVELEVQLWLSTPAIDDRPIPYRVTEADVMTLRQIYDRGNDDMPAWLAAISVLRAQGLEPLPDPKFFNELGGLMRYLCDLITKDPNASKTCKDGLPTTMPAAVPVLTPLRGSPVTATPPAKSTQQLPPSMSPGALLGMPLTPTEQKISLADAKAFQKMLCAGSSTGDFGPAGSATRTRLQDFYRARYYPKPNSAPDRVNTDFDLRALRSGQRAFPDCATLGFGNAFEVGLFSSPTQTPMETISDVVNVLSQFNIAVPSALRASMFDASVLMALHSVIPPLRQRLGVTDTTSRVLDSTLYDKIVRSQQ
jgi:hypothetical protein